MIYRTPTLNPRQLTFHLTFTNRLFLLGKLQVISGILTFPESDPFL
jgi:hypothetical protein